MSFCSFFGNEVFQNHFEPGIYVCAKCGYELFSSRAKYAHSSPWPAFTETIHADSVAKRLEHGRSRALKLLGLPGCLLQASGLGSGTATPYLGRASCPGGTWVQRCPQAPGRRSASHSRTALTRAVRWARTDVAILWSSQVSCGRCGNGLGHEFLDDGPKPGQSRF